MAEKQRKVVYTRIVPNSKRSKSEEIQYLFYDQVFDQSYVDQIPMDSLEQTEFQSLLSTLNKGDEVHIFNLDRLGPTLNSIEYKLEEILEKGANVNVNQHGKLSISRNSEDKISFVDSLKLINLLSTHLKMNLEFDRY